MGIAYRSSEIGTSRVDGQILQSARKIAEAESNQRRGTDRSVQGVVRGHGEPIYFRDLALFAFPKKTEANLAFVTGYDARTCRRWLAAAGNEPPAEAVMAVLAEISRRYSRRD